MFNKGDRVKLLQTTFFGAHFIEGGTEGVVVDIEPFGLYIRFDNIDNVYGVTFIEVDKIWEVSRYV